MSSPGILFDVDGTLVDNSYLHTLAWARAFVDAGHPVAMAEIHRRIGMGASVLVEDLLGREDEEVVDFYKAHMEPLEADVRAFPRAADLLRDIAARGGTVVLASSMLPEQAEQRLAMIGAGDAVAGIVHSGDVEGAKPEPDLWATAMAKHGLSADDCIAVGDAVWDVESSGRAGVRCIGLECGGVGEAELRDAGAITVCKDPAALLAALDESPIGELLRR
jgi:HAD superfamily hydrolase (TIGR01509 family)